MERLIKSLYNVCKLLNLPPVTIRKLGFFAWAMPEPDPNSRKKPSATRNFYFYLIVIFRTILFLLKSRLCLGLQSLGLAQKDSLLLLMI
jgi:hypothetical protein